MPTQTSQNVRMQEAYLALQYKGYGLPFSLLPISLLNISPFISLPPLLLCWPKHRPAVPQALQEGGGEGVAHG